MSIPLSHTQTLDLAKLIVERWMLWRRLQAQARERGEDLQELAVAELWEPRDEEVLRRWEAHLHAIAGKVPLPLDLEPSDLEGLECAS